MPGCMEADSGCFLPPHLPPLDETMSLIIIQFGMDLLASVHVKRVQTSIEKFLKEAVMKTATNGTETMH